MSRLKVRFVLRDGGLPLNLVAVGRNGWALLKLVEAGGGGLTTLAHPAPRWSHYIWKLRRMGVVIDTQDEPHGGEFSGSHGRYLLRSQVEILDIERPRARAA